MKILRGLHRRKNTSCSRKLLSTDEIPFSLRSSTYRIHLRCNLSVGEALKIHGTGRTGRGAGTAALTQSVVDDSDSSYLIDSGSSDLLILVSDSSVGADVRTCGASVTEHGIALGGAGVGLELILGKESDYLDGSGTRLGYRLGDILGTLSHTGQEDTCRGRLYGTELCVCFGKEIVVIDTCREHRGDLSDTLVRLDGGSENDHIGLLHDLLVVEHVDSLNNDGSVRLRDDLSDLTLYIVNVILLDGSSVELVEVLTGSSYVDIEYRDVRVGPVILDEHRVLGGIHAAYLGAVRLTALVVAAASHALDKYDILGLLVVAHPLEVSACGTRSVHEALELDGCDDIGALVISVLAELVEIDDVKSGSHYDGTVLDRYDLVFLLVVYSLGRTDLGTDAALSRLEICGKALQEAT